VAVVVVVVVAVVVVVVVVVVLVVLVLVVMVVLVRTHSPAPVPSACAMYVRAVSRSSLLTRSMLDALPPTHPPGPHPRVFLRSLHLNSP
jgi:hypothetical protein